MQSGTDKFMCVSCGFVKIEDAFPRAQLRQDHATSKQKCLSCVRSLQQLTCTVCKMDKAALLILQTYLPAAPVKRQRWGPPTSMLARVG
eukprot:1082860-Amphidinium_carterae.1